MIWWLEVETYIRNATEQQMVTARAASIHHRAHAIVAAQGPHAGTQTNTIRLTIVPRPMGKHPKNREWVGWLIIAGHNSGHRVYRKIEINRALTNIRTLSPNTI
jgi:hypothetical protein